ncbi:SIR2 family protein [Microbacterium sp. PAMC 28756]|uniref:SIR2 family protein n=1 Tax=Microbacterium sp. PAMC 28756 TaxID=1795053 RepID=UPI000B1F6A62|nr:SIR2 family protein [Microbacterium sp. PAMC 28756]
MTAEPVRAVPGVLARFESTFAAFAAGFDEGQYVLWLGSGISRDRVPSVDELLARVLEHLRSNAVGDDADGEFRVALDEVLRLASLTPTELESIDFSVPVQDWPLKDRITSVLVTKYSRVLDVAVGDDKPDDYLIWTALGVADTYGSPDLMPDVEHYCIAILMLEGLVATAITANWDGLLERALDELTSSYGAAVRVAVKPEDFRTAARRIEVIKIHGCAVRAREDEAAYRGAVVARHSQISAWTQQPGNQLMRKELEVQFSTRLTLMIGLSAQDENFHTMFATAAQDLPRSWPASPPAVVLSEEHVEPYHQSVLKTTYGSTYQGNGGAIKDSALLGAYGKPLLLALVLSSLAQKLSFLIEYEIQSAWGHGDVARLQADLRRLRDLVASHADPDAPETLGYEATLGFQRKFVADLIEVSNFVLTVFRTGRAPAPGSGRYEPLSDRPSAQAVLNPDYPAKQFGRLGVALSLIGRGLASGEWSAVPGTSQAAGDGVIQLVASDRKARVFFVRDSVALTQLELEGLFDDDDPDVLVVLADEEPAPQTRSPRPRFGRDGKSSAGRFSMASSIAETGSADDLYEAFKLASGF